MKHHDGTILDQIARYGVNVNGLIIPGRSIDNVLARHAFNLFIYNDDETFKVSLIGSATAVRYRGREVLLATQHQLRGVGDESRVAMLTDSGSHIITSAGRRGYEPHPESDAHDIVAFDFMEPCKARTELKRRFFDLDRCPPDTMTDKIIGMLLCGYPFCAQDYDLEENNHLGLTRRQVVCLPDSQPSDGALLAVRATQPLDENPDGMSGGSAFVIQYEDQQPRAYFAGIIVRGGGGLFYILKAGFVIAFLNSVFEE